MSLSFVTKAIQTTTADGVFEEQAVEHDDDGKGSSGGAGGGGVGLFEQLRQNKEEEEASRDEFQRSIMRGTLALDDDDAAHLEQLHQQRNAERTATQQHTESQLASFRAAQADRFFEQRQTSSSSMQQLEDSSSSDVVHSVAGITTVEKSKAAAPSKSAFAPTIYRIKKRRLPEQPNQEDGETIAQVTEHPSKKRLETSDTKLDQTTIAIDGGDASVVEPQGGLSSLLAGYSSSSDDDDT